MLNVAKPCSFSTVLLSHLATANPVEEFYNAHNDCD